jgi:hypothetical protein
LGDRAVCLRAIGRRTFCRLASLGGVLWKTVKHTGPTFVLQILIVHLGLFGPTALGFLLAAGAFVLLCITTVIFALQNVFIVTLQNIFDWLEVMNDYGGGGGKSTMKTPVFGTRHNGVEDK